VKSRPPRPVRKPVRKPVRRAPSGLSDRPVPRVVVERHGPLHAEIVVVGRELLRGEVDDRNARHIAAELTRRGALVHRVTVVDDLERSIAQAVSESLQRSVHLVVTAGGLGPAVDDRTLAGISDALRLPLAHSAPARDMVEAAYRALESKDGSLTPAREQMCLLPIGAEALPNAQGIAPGLFVRRAGGGTVVCVPGRPAEARAVLDEALARLKDLFPLRASASREVEAPTSDESALRPLLDRVSGEYPSVWIKSHPPARHRKDPARVTLRSFASNQKEADALVDGALRRLLSLAGNR
jgi:molybdopterin-biosynthesis enzyme MoeA-like protein